MCSRRSGRILAIALGILAYTPGAPGADCDENGIDDAVEIARGEAPDCDGDGVPDGCEVKPQVFPQDRRFGEGLYMDLAAKGDFDGDGDLDLLVTMTTRGRSVLLNDGRGGFDRFKPVAGLFDSGEVVTGDYDGNGDLDLAVVWGSSLWVSLNGGKADFRSPREYPSGVLQTSFGTERAVAFPADGDGFLDLGIIDRAGRVSILINRGDGSFRDPTGFPVGEVPFSIAWGDLDGDGDADLAVANLSRGAVSVLKNDGNGSFEPSWSHAVGARPHEIGVADLDGDGQTDLVVAYAYGSDPRDHSGLISVLFRVAPGVFSDPLELTAWKSPASVTAVDVDRDGDRDLVVRDFDGTISVLIQLGGGRFAEATSYGAPIATSSLLAGDIDGDAAPDLVLARRPADHAVILNLGDGTFDAPLRTGASLPSDHIRGGDLDGDGDLDLVLAGYRGLSILTNAGAGRFGPPLSLLVGDFAGTPVLADFDGDGDLDLALPITQSDELSVYLDPGKAGFAGPRSFGTGDFPRAAGALDLDADGYIDILVANAGSWDVWHHLNDGRGEFSPGPRTPLQGQGDAGRPLSLVVADMDGDGALDGFVLDTPALVAGDLDGDGHLDMALLSGELVLAAKVLGIGLFQDLFNIDLGSGIKGTSLLALDLDGNGLPELAVGTGVPADLKVFFQSSPGIFGEPVRCNSGGQVTSLAGGDIDGDAIPDVTAGNATGVSVLINGIKSPPLADRNGNGVPDACEVRLLQRGDVDGDGNLDLSDPVVMLDHLFLGGGALACRDAADADDSGRLDLTDAVFSLAYLFQGGGKPPIPFPGCGTDPTEDGLDCAAPLACR